MAKKKTIDITADTTQAKTTIGQLKDFTKKSMKESAKAADKSGKDISDAYKKMGIRTDASIRKSTQSAKANYAAIKNSGVASANEIRKAHKRMTATIKANNAQMRGGASKLSRVFTALKGPLLAFIGIAAGIKLFKDMTSAALENEIQVRKLKTQVENLGYSYDEQAESINRAIKATSRYAIVQSGDVSEVLQQLLFVTGDLTKSQEALNTVYDLAHLKGLSIQASTEMVGRALSGNVETLGRYFIEFKGLNESLGKNATLQDKAAFAMEFLNERVANSTDNMTKHERTVKRVRNEWASFVQLAGEKIFVVLDVLLIGLKRINEIQSAGGKLGLTVVSPFASLINMFGSAKEEIEETTESLTDLNREMVEAGRKTDKLERSEKKLSSTTKRLAAEIKARSDAIEEEKQKAIDALEEEIDLIDEALEKRKDAINEAARVQKAINEEIDEDLKDAHALLASLEEEVTTIGGIIDSIVSKFAEARKKQSQIGKSPVEVLIEDFEKEGLGGVREAGQLLANARIAAAEGDMEKVKALGEEAVRLFDKATAAATKVITADPTKLQESGFSTRGLPEAKKEAGGLEQTMVNILGEFQKLNESAIPGTITKIGELEGALEDGKGTVREMIQGIKEAKQEAQALKDKLRENTTSTHTTIMKTVQAQSEGGPVQPVKARTGRHFSGYGGGDKIPILGEAGEFMMRKEAVRDLGLQAAHAFNNRDIPTLLASLTAPVQRFKEGGAVQPQGSSDTVNVNLLMDKKSFGSTMTKDNAGKFVGEIKRMNIIHGRGKRVY